MSNQFNPFQRFRETLKHEDHIHNQIEACRQAFNRGDPNEVMYCVESLMLLITPAMEDEEFLGDIQELDDKWKIERAERQKNFEKQMRRARNGCPDLVLRPAMKPGIDHFKAEFMKACSLFERRHLMLKPETEDSI